MIHQLLTFHKIMFLNVETIRRLRSVIVNYHIISFPTRISKLRLFDSTEQKQNLSHHKCHLAGEGGLARMDGAYSSGSCNSIVSAGSGDVSSKRHIL